MKKMNATRNALLTLGMTHDVRAANAEVDAAESVAAMLRDIVEAHWKDATHLDMRELVRKAETALRAFES